jgi:hypothetical protein
LDSLLESRIQLEGSVDESTDSDWLLGTGGPGQTEGVVVVDTRPVDKAGDSVNNLLLIGSHSNTYFICKQVFESNLLTKKL